jgi:hypothetical protein
MLKKVIRGMWTALIIIGSTGWVIPLFICIDQMIVWGQVEVAPRIYDQKPMINSFPFLSFASQMLNIAMIWLSIVCVSWSSYLSWHFLWKKPNKEVAK